MARLTKKALVKHLDKSDKEDIIREVVILYDTFKNVKEFYQSELSEDANPSLEKYKRKIHEAYSRPNPKERTTNANLNRLLKEFKKISIYDRELADLMLYRAECGIAAIKKNNKRSATFYNCILATFKEAVHLITADGSMNEFKPRIDKICKDAAKGRFDIKKEMENSIKHSSSTSFC